MSSTATHALPTGNWSVDATHTTASFRVRHLGLSDFVGQFDDVGAELLVGDDGDVQLNGYVAADSVRIDDPDLRGHLLAPDFFDVERHPRLTYTADSVKFEGDEVVVNGKLRIKDHAGGVQARGTVSGPVEGFDGKRHVAIELTATVDRTAYGLEWQATTADGTNVLGNEVAIEVHVELVEA